MLKINRLCLQQGSTLLVKLNQLQVPAGQIATVMGPSGSGKSTLLRWVLGEPLKDFDCQGELWLNQQRIDNRPIHKRRIGLMYQQGDLFPHLSVAENLLFALPRQFSPAEKDQQVRDALQQVGLADKRLAMPDQLSGGEQSRIALIRSLLARPQALLLDEPFSALDTQLRGSVRDWAFNEIRQRQIPALLVTHDPADIGDGPLVTLDTTGD
ncbi:ATP-binding cassette domain-containing protein [Idiomarina seosinensis]|uniref:ATP-binding cassette domain-containing protein n=1 Tax=Idiomarina seosinensis TaxID=281739 RepID=UPI00384D55D6